MGTESTFTKPENLKLYVPDRFNFDQQPTEPQTPNQWFVQRYKSAYDNYGSPFLQLHESLDKFSDQVLPLSINIDFFASVLGGSKNLGHHVVYYEPEMLFYFLDADGMYKSVSQDKLMNQYRALLMKCAQDMPANVHKLNLVHEWRSDKVAKAVVNRAKSILLADSSFFSATSPHQRIKGIELHERLLIKFCDELLTCEPGKILMLQDAYLAFCTLLKQRDLNPIKRSDFKAMVVPLIKGEYNVSLRNDLVVDGRQGVRGWKNVRLNQTVPA